MTFSPPPPSQAQNVENGNLPPPPPENSIPRFLFIMNLVNTYTHFLLGGVTLLGIHSAEIFSNGSIKSHIYLCVIGYVILMSQAMLTLSPHNSWSLYLSQHERRRIHWIMQILGSTLALAGCFVRLANNYSFYKSAHGILGIIAMSLTIISLIGGILNLFIVNFKNNEGLIKFFHSGVGVATIIFAFLTLCLGFNNYSNVNTGLAITVSIAAMLGTVSAALHNMYSRLQKGLN